MDKKNMKESGNASVRKEYRSPAVKTIRIDTRSLICASQFGIYDDDATGEAW